MTETTTLIEHKKLRRLRYRAASSDFQILKSRKALSIDNFGGYLLRDNRTNAVVAGSRFDLSLADVEEWIGKILAPVEAKAAELRSSTRRAA